MRILVGVFSEQELKDGKDKIAVAKQMEESGLKYTDTKFIKNRGEIVAMKIWVCSLDETNTA